MNKRITNELLKIKKVRLIEDKIAYEDLAVMDNFSEDEITFELNRKIIKEKKDYDLNVINQVYNRKLKL